MQNKVAKLYGCAFMYAKNAQCSAGSLNHSDVTADASNKMAVVSREARKGAVLNDLKIHLSTYHKRIYMPKNCLTNKTKKTVILICKVTIHKTPGMVLAYFLLTLPIQKRTS